jgi:succinoglycan biosynthesis transport protein ExoP
MPELVRQWAGDYDFVLVDIPPILLSADAELLAHSLEHLILVVEAAGITQGELRRAGRQIEKLQPAAVGVLVNRVRPFEGGGYLHNLLVEYLTARKSRDYFTQPAWLLEIRTRLAAFTDWRTGLFNRKTTSGNPA